MQEEWRDVVGYEGLYQVSNIGRVKRLKGYGCKLSRILKPCKNHFGYIDVSLCKDGKEQKKKVHRLVAAAFIQNPDNKPEIDHIDGTRDNNRADNLRWVTHKENLNFQVYKRHRSIATSSAQKGKTGKQNNSSKPIICIEKNKIFWGCCEASRITGVCHQNISANCRGKIKNAGGFHWRYATPDEIERSK